MSRARLMAIAVALTSASSVGIAQVPTYVPPRGIVENPCPPVLRPPPELAQALQSPEREAIMASPPPVIAEYLEQQELRTRSDWANLCRYINSNAALADSDIVPKAVFIGDSITEGWFRLDPTFFSTNEYVGRGISGQVSGQNLLRFQQDAVSLNPVVVHIMIGTNDVAGNAGPTTFKAVEDNITAMVRLAQANEIAVVLATIPPASDFPWQRGMEPASKIEQINNWIREFASKEELVLADYYSALVGDDGGLSGDWSDDGVHPNTAGYEIMKPIAGAAIHAAQ